MFTEDEVLAVVKAVARAERTIGAANRAMFFKSVERWAEERAEGNRRLLEYARTGDLGCLDGAQGNPEPKEERK